MKFLNAFAIFCLCLIPTAAFAQSEVGFGWSKISYDGVSAAKGFAGVASSGDISWAAFSNSAKIPYSNDEFSAKATFQSFAPDGIKTTNFGLGAAYNIGNRFGVSVAGIYRSGDSYEGYDDDGQSTGSITPKDLKLAAGFGMAFAEKFSAGVNLSYMQSDYGTGTKDNAFTADIFLMGKFSDFAVALGVAGVGSLSSDSDYDLPSTATLAGDWSRIFSEKHGICADLDLNYWFNGGFTAAFGAEYGFNELIFLRAGYHYATDEAVLPSFATLGLGFRIVGVIFDFSFLTANDDIGNTLTFGLGYAF